MKIFIFIISLFAIANLAESQTCSLLYNIDYYGNDLFAEATKLPSVDSCCALCAKTVRCVAYTYLPLTGACWLKHTVGNERTVSPGPIFSGVLKNTTSTLTSTSTSNPIITSSSTISTSTFNPVTTSSSTFSTSSTTTATSDCNAQFNAAALEAHNTYRALHHAPPLTLDPKKTDNATAYSKKLAFEIKTFKFKTLRTP